MSLDSVQEAPTLRAPDLIVLIGLRADYFPGASQAPQALRQSSVAMGRSGFELALLKLDKTNDDVRIKPNKRYRTLLDFDANGKIEIRHSA